MTTVEMTLADYREWDKNQSITMKKAFVVCTEPDTRYNDVYHIGVTYPACGVEIENRRTVYLTAEELRMSHRLPCQRCVKTKLWDEYMETRTFIERGWA